jgi:HK97 family phage major capsid protein
LNVQCQFVKSEHFSVTEEFGEDSDAANSELNRFLDINVNTVIDAQIINGAGTGETLTGLLASAQIIHLFSGISAANIKDLVRKMRTAIVKNRGSKYSQML